MSHELQPDGRAQRLLKGVKSALSSPPARRLGRVWDKLTGNEGERIYRGMQEIHAHETDFDQYVATHSEYLQQRVVQEQDLIREELIQEAAENIGVRLALDSARRLIDTAQDAVKPERKQLLDTISQIYRDHMLFDAAAHLDDTQKIPGMRITSTTIEKAREHATALVPLVPEQYLPAAVGVLESEALTLFGDMMKILGEPVIVQGTDGKGHHTRIRDTYKAKSLQLLQSTAFRTFVAEEELSTDQMNVDIFFRAAYYLRPVTQVVESHAPVEYMLSRARQVSTQ